MTEEPPSPRRQIPEGLRRRALRRNRYVRALGPVRGRWYWLREVLGDRRDVRVRYRGRDLALRLNTSDILVLFSVFEREDYAIELSSPPAAIVDAGAYTGFSSIYLAERYPRATILALEPDPSNFALLVRNARPYPNVIPVQQALWHRDGRAALRDPGTGHWAFFLASDAPERPRGEVETVALATLMKRFALSGVDLLKINVEGAEKEIFEHSGDWMGRVGAIVTHLHDHFRPGCSEAFEAATVSFARVVREDMTGWAWKSPVLPRTTR